MKVLPALSRFCTVACTSITSVFLSTVFVAPEVVAASAGSANGTNTHAEKAVADSLDTYETVVVTASRSEQNLQEVPSAISVVAGEWLDKTPVDNFGDLLRNVQGVNVAQTGARDVWVNTRGSTGVVVQGVLLLVDNRNLFSDWNGFVQWDTVPLDPYEIRQIEVVRGPGSAVWGSNATDGIINIITKSPREIQGTSVMVGGGEFETFQSSVTHAGVRGKLGYKLSGLWHQQNAYDRPTGSIPGTDGPTNPGGTKYPEYHNADARQPRFNARLDYEKNDDTSWSFSGSYLGQDGTFMTPVGPWEFRDGYYAHGQVDFSHKLTRVTAYSSSNRLHGVYNLFGTTLDGTFRTFHVDVTDSRPWGGRQFLTYGISLRYDTYDDNLTQNAPDRDKYGFFIQDEVQIFDPLRFVGGVRWDHIDPMGSVFSPRTALLFSPIHEQTFRLAWSRAFQAPTVVESHISFTNNNVITVPTDGGPLNVVFPIELRGNTGLDEERLDAFEVGWVGKIGTRLDASVDLYRNELKDFIRFIPAEFYTSQNPPPNFPFPDSLLDVPPPMGFAGIPSALRYQNLGNIVNQGVEFGLGIRATDELSFLANYSWQDRPSVEDIDSVPLLNGNLGLPINLPPRHRFNIGATYDQGRFYVNGRVNFQDNAFWTDVLDQRFWGSTDSFSMVTLNGGVRLHGGRALLMVSAQNAFDENVQQHVWGDIIGRKVTSRVVYRF